MGGYMVKEGNCHILKLSLSMKHRKWFLELWDKTSRFSLPVTLSTLNSIAESGLILDCHEARGASRNDKQLL
jgi:hypothetical protein